METNADTLPKVRYLHVDALLGLTDLLNQAITDVARHIEESDGPFKPFGDEVFSMAYFEQTVKVALSPKT